MKKTAFLYIILIFFSFNLFADDNITFNGDLKEQDYKLSSIKKRSFEIGFLHTRIGISNNYLNVGQILQEQIVLEFNKLDNGLKVNFDFSIIPFNINIIHDELWGYGFSLGFDAIGIMDISRNMLTLNDAFNDSSLVSGAVFAEVRFPGFYNLYNFKLKISPSLYYPILYIDGKPCMNYYLNNNSYNSTVFNFNYNFRIYTAYDMGNNASSKLTAQPGVDFHLGVEYPLAEVIKLKEKYNFLDFKVGLDLLNIPLIPSKMKHYLEIKGKIGDDNQILIDNLDDDFININEPLYGFDKIYIMRPFKLLIWIDWKPIETIPVNFISTLGFAISPLYEKSLSMEGGIKAQYNISNIFIPSFGIGYHDRLWRNCLDMALIIKNFSMKFGVEMYSQTFEKSWQGKGLGLNIGFNIVIDNI